MPGLRVNLSRSGVSMSVGARGSWYTIGPRGRRVTVGLPGSGLYWTEQAPPAPAIKTRRVGIAVAFDDATDCRCHRGQLVVGKINCRHGSGYNRR
jgi:hypothetical protein